MVCNGHLGGQHGAARISQLPILKGKSSLRIRLLLLGQLADVQIVFAVIRCRLAFLDLALLLTSPCWMSSVVTRRCAISFVRLGSTA